MAEEVKVVRTDGTTGEETILSLDEAIDKLSNFYKDLEEVRKALLEGVVFPSSVATYSIPQEVKVSGSISITSANRERAKKLLRHYLERISKAAGLPVDADVRTEWDDLADSLIDAAKEEIREEEK